MRSTEIPRKKLSNDALRLAKNNKDLRRDIGDALGIVDQTTLFYIRENRINGWLTVHAVTQLIHEFSELPIDQILVDEKLQKTKKNSAAVSTL